MFEFNMSTRIFYGIGCRTTVVSVLRDNGWTRIAVVVDHNVAETESVKNLLSAIQGVSVNIVVGFCTVSEPTYDFLDVMRNDFEGKDIQAVIGIGGGSALDTAKAIAVLVNNKMPAIQYRGFNKMTEPVLPVIAIPTTAGTGSEVTPNASFIDSSEKRKMGINGEAVRPKYALLDPELTLSCPERPTVSAGVDSIVHAVEAYVAKKTNPMARMFAKEGFRNVFTNLPLVIKEPHNINYRERVMYGAFLSGIALMNSGTGPAAAMSYPLGVHFKVSHGIGGGIFLPHVMAHNVQNGYIDYAGLYESINSDAIGCDDARNSQLLVEEMQTLWKELSVPDDLSNLGVTSDFSDRFIKETLDLKGALDQNPVPFYGEEIASVLRMLRV